ncbi:MAG TPA: hypothetical protein VG122_18070 [Gemmata sp.]|nr:hypothetical protein [Gemmata sp.]
MRKELEQRLVERWPTWFNTGGDIRQTAMPRGFEHGDGWFDILWRLCEDLEPLVAKFDQETGSQFEVLQVKEKFGGLRFYVNWRRNETIRQRIGIAADESFHTCEICGQPGELREDSWIKTLCDLHDTLEYGSVR